MVERKEVEALLELVDAEKGRWSPHVPPATLAALCRAWLALEDARRLVMLTRGRRRMTRSTNMEHVEVLRDLSEVCRAAIKAGDWKVDGACDPDSLLRHADAAIASLSAQPPAEAQARPVEWMREWQGSGPQRGFHIREATRLHNNRVVAYLGDQVDSGEVDRLIAEHNGKHPNGEPLRPAEAQAQGGGEVVYQLAGDFGREWLDCSEAEFKWWQGKVRKSRKLYTAPQPTPVAQGFDAALREIAESDEPCTSGDGHARCIDIATRALAAQQGGAK